MVNGLAPILAPVIGGQILSFSSWHSIFQFLALIGLIMAAATLIYKETLQENGFDVTFTITPGCNTLVRGIPQSLIGMKRYNICESVSVDQVLEWVSAARG